MSKWLVDIHGEIEGDYELICKADSLITLDKVKQARKETQKLVDMCGSDTLAELDKKAALQAALLSIDVLITESEDQND